MCAHASTHQLGSVITQDNRSIVFYSKKLSKTQQNYTVTDLELLSIVMVLKEFHSMLLGQDILICSDHKNLESDLAHLTSQKGLHWRLLVEEFGVAIKHIKGVNNSVADALSRLDFAPSLNKNNSGTVELIFANLLPEDSELFLLSMQDTSEHQMSAIELKKRMTAKSKRKHTKHSVNNFDVVLENNKVFIPIILHPRIIA